LDHCPQTFCRRKIAGSEAKQKSFASFLQKRTFSLTARAHSLSNRAYAITGMPDQQKPWIVAVGASGVIGVVLSGALDDGSSGLAAIHHAGGLTMVLTSADPVLRGMPENG
jgi:hypothetical protein